MSHPPKFTLLRWAKRFLSGQPHLVLATDEVVYLRRWYLLPRNPFVNLYLHNIVSSDPADAYHDHPWHSVSILLKGTLLEDRPFRRIRAIRRFRITYRSAESAHRLVVPPDQNIWTLFATGPRVRQWGFLVNRDGHLIWVPHDQYTR
jgi:hypothetical protein